MSLCSGSEAGSYLRHLHYVGVECAPARRRLPPPLRIHLPRQRPPPSPRVRLNPLSMSHNARVCGHGTHTPITVRVVGRLRSLH